MTLADAPTIHLFDPLPDVTLARVTVEQFETMVDAGIYPEERGWELIDGLVVRNDSDRGEGVIKQRHYYAVKKLTKFGAARVDGADHHLQVQLCVSLTEWDEPEPDGATLRGPTEAYELRKPGPADIACVIEVSNATLRFDRTTKLRMYAAAGIPQYVIVNLVDDVIEVHAQPDAAAGSYAVITTIARDATVTLNLFDGQTLAVPAADLLP